MKKRIATLTNGTKRFLDTIDFRSNTAVVSGELAEYKIHSNGAIRFKYYSRTYGEIGSKIISRDLIEKIEEVTVTKSLLDELFEQAHLMILEAGHKILQGKRGALYVQWDNSKF